MTFLRLSDLKRHELLRGTPTARQQLHRARFSKQNIGQIFERRLHRSFQWHRP